MPISFNISTTSELREATEQCKLGIIAIETVLVGLNLNITCCWNLHTLTGLIIYPSTERVHVEYKLQSLKALYCTFHHL